VYFYKPEITSVKTQLFKKLIQLSTRSRLGRRRWSWGCWVPMTNIRFRPQDGAASVTSMTCVTCGHSGSQMWGPIIIIKTVN